MALWHGLTDEQVLAVWDEMPWRSGVVAVLAEAAICQFLPYEDRTRALAILNEGMLVGVLKTDLDYPLFAGRCLISMAAGVGRTRWWHRWKVRRIQEQITACKRVLNTAMNFIGRSEQRIEVASSDGQSALDRLLS